MKVRFENGRFKLEASMTEIYDTCGGLTDENFRDGFLHLADVAAQNDDEVGLGLVSNAIGMPLDQEGDSPRLPDEVRASLSMLLTEAMAVGKEITLRKLSRVLDPHGEFIDVPDEWIGKGAG